MTAPFQLPPASEEAHRAIDLKAATVLGNMVDGNGLKAAQVRLVNTETQIHTIPASITIILKPEIARSELRGKVPKGIVLGSDADIGPQAAGLAQSCLGDNSIQQEVLRALQQAPAEGFGMDKPLVLSIKSMEKTFSVISLCMKCNGVTTLRCSPCLATGKAPCQTCRGQGFTACPGCSGTGMVQESGTGNSMACTRCQNTGRVLCPACRGQQQMVCGACNGKGSTPCTNCGQSGSQTNVYQVDYKAQCQFEVEWRSVAPEVRQIIEKKLGLKQLATKSHAEIYWLPPETQEDHLLIPCVVFLPVAAVEFSVEGKVYPAVVAGLQGRIVQIDPLLDGLIKPGISALMKLSKGPMAVQALIDTACKYKLIRQALAGLARYSKKDVYQTLVREYPAILSDKYARATIRYAHSALLSISAGPRYKGLAAGTALAGLLAAGYYMTHCRQLILAHLEQRDSGQHVVLLDIAVWLLGYVITVFAIKLMTAAAFKKMLPQTVQAVQKRLPAAGMQGLAALFTSGLLCLIIAACASDKPAWIMHILKMPG